jgi:CheY-like chemotaxis protein
MSRNQLSVLIVDDDDVAIEAVERALKQEQLNLPVISASDGMAALQLLRGDGTVPLNGIPLVILLDLNMPGMNGMEFLSALRADPKLQHNVVYVWTTSNSDKDRDAAYRQHVAGYMVKSSSDRGHGYLADLLKLYQNHVTLKTCGP